MIVWLMISNKWGFVILSYFGTCFLQLLLFSDCPALLSSSSFPLGCPTTDAKKVKTHSHVKNYLRSLKDLWEVHYKAWKNCGPLSDHADPLVIVTSSMENIHLKKVWVDLHIVACHLPRAPSYSGVRTSVEGSQMLGDRALAVASK